MKKSPKLRIIDGSIVAKDVDDNNALLVIVPVSCSFLVLFDTAANNIVSVTLSALNIFAQLSTSFVWETQIPTDQLLSLSTGPMVERQPSNGPRTARVEMKGAWCVGILTVRVGMP